MLSRLLRSPRFLLSAAVGVCLLVTYRATLFSLAETWSSSRHYSHGFLVPIFAVAVLWMRRHDLRLDALRPSGWGLAVLFVSGIIRLVGAYFYYPWLDALSLLPSLIGLALLLGGRPLLRWSLPAIAFLAFMMPLPFMVEGALARPLQSFATAASTYVLQTLGFPAISEGNVIIINESRIGVVEVCNGLGMLVVFFALSSAMALVIQRTLWERAVVLCSAIPVALIANVVRITLTGVFSETVSRQFAHSVFHDYGGWLMMPLALALLALELRALSWLMVNPPAAAEPVPLLPGYPASAGARAADRPPRRLQAPGAARAKETTL